MTILNVIPEDLLIFILSNLSPLDLSVACHVCKTFYRISNSLLYRNIDLTRISELQTINLFCQSLSQRPQLAAYIRSLVLAEEAPSQLSKGLTEYQVSLPKLTTLTLSRAQKMWLAELKTLLMMTPSLEVFNCDLELDAEPENGPPAHLDCQRLRDSMCPVKSTLKKLRLSVHFIAYVSLELVAGGSYENGDAWGIKGRIGSLIEFEQLRWLEIPIAILFGWSASTDVRLFQILPPNLETLVLSHDFVDFWVYEWRYDAVFVKLEEFLRDRKVASNSTNVTIMIEDRVSTPSDRPNENRWKDLKAEFNDCGVLLQIEQMSQT